MKTGEFFIDLLGHSENEYIRQRSIDIEEICTQLLEEVCGASPTRNYRTERTLRIGGRDTRPAAIAGTQSPLLAGTGAGAFRSYVARRNSGTFPRHSHPRGCPKCSPGADGGQEVVVDAIRGFVVPIVRTCAFSGSTIANANLGTAKNRALPQRRTDRRSPQTARRWKSRRTLPPAKNCL